MYCSFSNSLRVPLTVLTTLFIVVLGIMIATGISNFTLKEAGTIMFKLALIWGFATNPEWGIGIGYKFFMGFAEEASNIVLKVIPTTGSAAPSLTSPDAILTGFIGGFSGGPTASGGFQTGIDPAVPPGCLVFMFIIFLIMLLFMPMAILVFVFLIISYFGNFARAMLNYLTALVLISFLFIFAPFFLAFALFRTTAQLFEDWIRHLIGYSLQMVIMFAFMAFLAMIPFTPFLASIVNLVRSYDQTVFNGMPWDQKATFSMPFCSFCEYHTPNESLLMSGNALTCMTKAETEALPGFNKANYFTNSDDINSPSRAQYDNKYYVIPIVSLLQRSDLALFIMMNAIALWLICKVVNDFMKKAPELAADLGQLPIAAALGAGAAGSAHGYRINYLGMDAIRSAYIGLKNGMMKSFAQSERDRLDHLRSELKRQGLDDDEIKQRLLQYQREHSFLANPFQYIGRRIEHGKLFSRLGRGIHGDQIGDTEQKNLFGFRRTIHHRRDGLIQGLLHGATEQGLFAGLNTAAYENAVRRAQEKRAKAEERAKEADEQVHLRRETMEGKRQEIERVVQEERSTAEERKKVDEERKKIEEELRRMQPTDAKRKEKEEEAARKTEKLEELEKKQQALEAEQKKLQDEHAKKRTEFEDAEYHAKEEHKRVLEADRKLKHEQEDSHLAKAAAGEHAKGLLDITGADIAGFTRDDETGKKLDEMLESHKARKKSKDEEGLDDYKHSLENAISGLETMLANSPSLSPDEVAHIQGMIRSARNGLGTAGSVQSAGMISSEIDSISRYIQSAAMSSKK
jgi:type IV secretory pathway VirB6-like protein